MEKKYNIGLDIGTTSVGWAVVECNNQKIIRKGNKRLWGACLFEPATTAEARRSSRSSRRRYDRRRERIRLLQEEFKHEINKVDKDFFTKLKESFYNEKDLKNKTIKITKEEQKQINQYNDKYKTIYHLRKDLINNQEKHDIREVYLAIHHIIKYRGNFLYGSNNFNAKDLNIEEKLKSIFDELYNNPTFNCGLVEEYSSLIDYKKLEEALLDKSKNDRKIRVKELLENYISKDFIGEFIKLINGNKFNFTKMISLDVEDKKVELSFDGTDYDDKYDTIVEVIGERIEILSYFKELFDMLFLKRLFQGSKNTNISSLMVEKYYQHKEDLKFLKELFKNDRDIYNIIFKDKKEPCLYQKYVRNSLTNEEFIKELRKYLPDIFEKEIAPEISTKYLTDIEKRMDNGEFLPRITDSENGKYPYQLNKDELIKIIENQGKYYDFLLDKTNDGTYKIVKLLEFRIPYYVGPLTSEKNSKFAWMIRNKENIKITPYNFDEVINKEATAEKFIKRMISHCTYLLNEEAMPASSIFYSKYKILNEIKQIKVNGQKLTLDMQHKIISELIMKSPKSVTSKMLKEYLYSISDFEMFGEDINITGFSAEEKFANTMKSYVDFFGEKGIFENTEYNEDDADKIIELITIFEDKDILRKKIKNEYNSLNDEQINNIMRKKYKGWSSLSKKLLTEKYYIDKETSLKKSIIDLMYETEENFMQIINNEKYNFQEMINEYNEYDSISRVSYKLVENLATSPAIKRGIFQSLKVVDEIVKYIGYNPENIMIEMAREDGIKKRTEDRKKYLTNLYKENKVTIDNYNQLTAQLNKYDKIDNIKLFLYFIQEGKSLYSGKPLNIEDLNLYEIDHIIPRTLIKDDSIDNKALVLKEENQKKAASFTVPEEFRTPYNIKWWNHLKDLKLISNKKMYNLTRKTYKEEDIEGFINRQIVETRQITKHVAHILESFYDKTKVIYLKANLSHYYREKFELYKFRDINDYHHAHDAYLSCVIGEYKQKFMKKRVKFEFIKRLNYELRQINKKTYYGYVINGLDTDATKIMNNIIKNESDNETGEVTFDAESFNNTVINNLYCNDILISKKTEIRTGEFYNQTKNKKGKSGVSLKSNLKTELYGSYTRLNPSYAVFVKYTYKNQKKQKLIGIPIYILEKAKTNKLEPENYIRNLLKLTENDKLEINNKKIPFFSLLNWEGQICYLVGATDKVEVCNAKEFNFNKDIMQKYKYTLNKVLNNKNFKVEEEKYSKELEEIIIYIVKKIEKEYLLYNNLVPELKQMINYDNMSILTLEEKENTIKELLKLLKCNSTNANFKFLNSKYSSAFGKKCSRTIEKVKITHLSSTGIWRHESEF